MYFSMVIILGPLSLDTFPFKHSFLFFIFYVTALYPSPFPSLRSLVRSLATSPSTTLYNNISNISMEHASMSTTREKVDEVIGKKIKKEAHLSTDRTWRRLGTAGTLNTITPCAACKLLRRRCTPECPFSPYFSPHEPQKFASVHRVFGASNVSKILKEVPESVRAEAANSLAYEANLRLRDPISGCLGVVFALQRQIQVFEAEIQAVRAEILKCMQDNNANYVNSNYNIAHSTLLAPHEEALVAAFNSSSSYSTATSSIDLSGLSVHFNEQKQSISWLK